MSGEAFLDIYHDESRAGNGDGKFVTSLESDDSGGSLSLGDRLLNELNLAGAVVTDTPGKFVNALSDDWENHKGTLARRGVMSLGIGLGSGILMARSPALAKVGLGALGIYQVGRFSMAARTSLADAWNARSQTQLSLIACRATTALGHESALMVETLPGVIAGGAGGMALGRRVRMLSQISGRVADRVAFLGPGVDRLPSHLLSQEGKLNAIELSEILASKHPWQGAEIGRSIDVRNLLAGRSTRGTAASVDISFSNRPGRLQFHTHSPHARLDGRTLVNSKPSAMDLAETAEVGIIQSGQRTTLYMGATREVAAQQAAGEALAPTLRAIVLDSQNKVAVQLETVFNSATGTYKPTIPRPLHYGEALKTLRNWDGTWQGISSISTDNAALSQEGMIELLKLGS